MGNKTHTISKIYLEHLLSDIWTPMPEGASSAFYSELCNELTNKMESNSLPLKTQLNLVNRFLTIDNMDFCKLISAIRILDKKLPHNNLILGFYCRAYYLAGYHTMALKYYKRITNEQLFFDSLGMENDCIVFHKLQNMALLELGEDVYDPEDLLSWALILRAEGQYEEGRRIMDKAVKVEASLTNLFFRGWFAWRLGDAEDAFSWFERVLNYPNEDDEIRLYYSSFIYVYYGMKEKALSVVQKLLANRTAANLYCAADIYSLIGEIMEAFHYLQAAFDSGLPARLTLLSDPALQNLYHSIEGKELIRKHIREMEVKDQMALKEAETRPRTFTLQCECSNENGSSIYYCSIHINQNPVTFIIDTGTTDTIVNKYTSYYAFIQPSDDAYLEDQLENWNISTSSFQGKYTTVSGQKDEPLQGAAVIVTENTCPNILGMCCLVNFSKIALRGSLKELCNETHTTFSRIPFKWIDGLICISCQIELGAVTFDSGDSENIELSCILDTGSQLNLMPVNFFRQSFRRGGTLTICWVRNKSTPRNRKQTF